MVVAPVAQRLGTQRRLGIAEDDPVLSPSDCEGRCHRVAPIPAGTVDEELNGILVSGHVLSLQPPLQELLHGIRAKQLEAKEGGTR